MFDRGRTPILPDPSFPLLPAESELRCAFGLTMREAQVTLCIARGASDRQIGRALGLSVHTVGHHAESIFLKLGIHSRRGLPLLLMELKARDRGPAERIRRAAGAA